MADPIYNEDAQRLVEMDRRQRNCEAMGHPFEQRELVQYQGRSSKVLAECTGCGALYTREATSQERQELSDVFKLEFRV